jgi:hypothetical protein
LVAALGYTAVEDTSLASEGPSVRPRPPGQTKPTRRGRAYVGVELPHEATELVVFEVLGQHVSCQLHRVGYDERAPVGGPLDACDLGRAHQLEPISHTHT